MWFKHVSKGYIIVKGKSVQVAKVYKSKTVDQKPQHPGFPRGPPPWY